MTGDSGNELIPIVLDRNVHINEYKVATCDIRPGRRPRGRELEAYVADYRRRAGLVESAKADSLGSSAGAELPGGQR